MFLRHFEVGRGFAERQFVDPPPDGRPEDACGSSERGRIIQSNGISSGGMSEAGQLHDGCGGWRAIHFLFYFLYHCRFDTIFRKIRSSPYCRTCLFGRHSLTQELYVLYYCSTQLYIFSLRAVGVQRLRRSPSPSPCWDYPRGKLYCRRRLCVASAGGSDFLRNPVTFSPLRVV